MTPPFANSQPKPPAPLSAADSLAIPFFYLALFIAAFNTVMRRDAESSVTLYYVMTPLFALVLLATTAWFFRWAVGFVVVALYGVLAARVYGTPQDFYLAQIIFYGFLFIFLGIMRYLLTRDPYFSRNIMRTIWVLMLAVFALAILQATIGFRFPNVPGNQAAYLTAYFFTANDVALFVSAALAVILMRRGHWLPKVLAAMAVFSLDSINDAKAALLAIVVMIAVFYASQMSRKLKIPPLVLGGVAALAIVALGVGGSAIQIQVGGVDLYDLLAEPIERVTHLQTYNMPGSVYDRTDALIINLREFVSTVGFGLGPGGSTYVLSLPENRLATAESMHNAVAELAVEMGVVFIIPFLLGGYKIVSRMMQVQPTRGDYARFALLCGLPLLSVTQSSGYISNYASWMVLFLILCAPESFWSNDRIAAPAASRVERQRMPWERGYAP